MFERGTGLVSPGDQLGTLTAELSNQAGLINPEPERIGLGQIAGFAQRLEDLAGGVLALLLEHDALRPVGLSLAILALPGPQGLDLLIGREQGLSQGDLVAARPEFVESLMGSFDFPGRAGVTGLCLAAAIGEVAGRTTASR